MPALAAATRRSAAATSGRRSSSCEGTPIARRAGVKRLAAAGLEAEGAGLAADEHGDGVLVLGAAQAGVFGLGAGGLELRLGLLHVGNGRGAALDRDIPSAAARAA